jgi:hypothetical protein
MKLPNRENAHISPIKLTDYLLSETHSVGRSKAKFLRFVGFNENNREELKNALLSMAIREISITLHRHHMG